MQGSDTSRCVSFQHKFIPSDESPFQSSLFMREWALDRWTEGTQVNLYKELPKLKVDIRLEREAEELRLQQEESETERLEGEPLRNEV